MTEPRVEAPPQQAAEENESTAIRELRAALAGPLVRVRVAGGVDVHCWVSSVSFRCPGCDTENLAGLSTSLSGIDQVNCGDCGLAFEIEFR
jgi:hypothetical protein